MTFMMFTSATGSDPVQLGLDYLRIGATLLREAGATRLAASQAIAAGEGTGALTVSSTWESLDDAVTGTNKFRAHPDVVASMAANDAVPVSRMVTTIDEERGQADGAFVGATFGTFAKPDPGRLSGIADASSDSFIGAGCNGIRLLHAIAAGEQTGLSFGLMYTDSLDAWAQGLQAAGTNSALRSHFDALGWQPAGRAINRVIGTA